MKRRFFLILIVLVLTIGWVFLSPLLASWLVVEHRLERADAILVLSGSAAYQERTRFAAGIFASGAAPRVIISDDGGRAGWSNTEHTNLPYVELARRELVQNGVPFEAITQLPGYATGGTDGEAVLFAESVAGLQISSIMIVTSPYHTRRAYGTFTSKLSGRGISVGIVSPPLNEGSPLPQWWWLRRTGWQNVGIEYVKTLGYWAFYW